jgi:hypothetical protein
VLELVQTMRHFQILSKTVSIGGADSENTNILTQEIHAKYTNVLNEFRAQIGDVMNLKRDGEQSFEMAFFRLRTTIKVSHLLINNTFHFVIVHIEYV